MSDMGHLSERLAAALPVDGAAEDHAWELAHAAYVRRVALQRRRARRRRRLAVLVATATALTLALAAMTSAGDFVADLVVGERKPAPREGAVARDAAARVDVPGGGRLLVVRGGWARVAEDGARPRRIARADEATFSAFGRYVAVAHGPRLTVHAVDGRQVWSRLERNDVHTIRWAPDGLRIAYRTGSLLRVVDGNGERVRTVAHAAGRAVAWRPGPRPVLTYLVATRRSITFRDVVTGEELARVRAPAELATLTWSSDGKRLLAVGAHELRVLSPRGAALGSRRARGRTRFGDAAFAPRRHRIAVVVRRARGDTLVVDRHAMAVRPLLFAPVWSPDARWIAITGDSTWGVRALAAGNREGPPRRPRTLAGLAGGRVAGWRRMPR